jgi:hypothetical protein
MEILIVIFLAVIAYFLWRIYRQREDERAEIASEKYQAELEQKRKERFKDYPHLYGKLEGNWLDVFASQAENGLPLLKLAFLLMLQTSTKIDYSEGSHKWDMLWYLSEELLEHLEKFHEGSIVEHEIAVITYWQIAAEAVGKLIKENPEIEGRKFEVEPYTNINKITLLFPKKANHPDKEISFSDEKGLFPRESKGSAYTRGKMKALGL